MNTQTRPERRGSTRSVSQCAAAIARARAQPCQRRSHHETRQREVKRGRETVGSENAREEVLYRSEASMKVCCSKLGCNVVLNIEGLEAKHDVGEVLIKKDYDPVAFGVKWTIN